MIDKLKIGRDKEKECAKAMQEAAQIRVWWLPPRAKYSKHSDGGGQDIFGVFDFIAVDYDGAIIGVQVCRRRPREIAERREKLCRFAGDYRPAIRVCLSYYDKSGFILEELMPDMVWRIKALLPYETEEVNDVRENAGRTSGY